MISWGSLLSGWCLLAVAGCLVLTSHATAPGASGHPRTNWPGDTVIPLDERRPTLLLFLHPLCPCSKASIDELKEILECCGDRVRPHAVVLQTTVLDSDCSRVIDRSLADVPGIDIRRDQGGELSRRFGVLTSGHVLLYGPEGGLIFSGGITPARGHSGDSLGRRSLLEAIMGRQCDRGSTPLFVFGCPLFGPRGVLTVEARP